MRVTALIPLALLAGAAPAHAEDFGPWDLPRAPAVTASPTFQPRPAAIPRGSSIPGIQTTAFYLSFKFYQQVISPIDGPRCEHRPTCSLYAVQAMKKHPLIGAFMALDRLWRGNESSAIRNLGVVLGPEGQIFRRDPLEESDFWIR